MTLLREPLVAADLTRIGEENNVLLAHQNLGASASVSTSIGSEVSAAVNCASAATYNFWQATPASGEAAVLFEFAVAETVGFVGLVAHGLADVSASVVIEYSVDGLVWQGVGIAAFAPEANGALGLHFRERAATHWRCRVTGATGNVIIGVVFLSRAIVTPTTMYQGYRPNLTPTRVELEPNVSEGAHLLGTSVKRRGSSLSATLENLPNYWVRSETWLTFQRAFNDAAPFFWAWRPAKYPDLAYCWRNGPVLAPVNSTVTDHMDAQISMSVFDVD